MGTAVGKKVNSGSIGYFGDSVMREVDAGEKRFLVVRIKNKYYAADSHCPQGEGVLYLGQLDGTVVTCPQHHCQFDLADGRPVA
jgi:3-phenylpropionate/trans-cinnamate dioxygenase ferredoxin component